MKTTTTTKQWVRLKLGPKHNYVSGCWHQHDGEKTLCGFNLFDRAVHGELPPGARTCRFCALAAGDG